MNKPGRKGLTRLWDATRYSRKGLSAAWQHEEAFRQEVTLALILFPSAFWLGQTALERIALIIPVVLVVIVELINSAIEAAIDRIGTEKHPLSGQAKDIGSAAVLMSLLLCLTSWGLIIVDRFF
ncbi:diacylglycerol kinase [Spongiibacter sp. KMU-158]|uniref:Diacylglycerol kinase n=2 Tax=Spongiibacter pelagi TaxID=2760804 RepID=A0A927C3K5_9GAMM|nr:diacylglycerol kinase [Spongiibacter pelagi]